LCFLQAEDGIRDFHVTGVQTCALPISRGLYLVGMLLPGALALAAPRFLLIGLPITLANFLTAHTYQHEIMWHYTAYLLGVLAVEIGRASCRERQAISGRAARVQSGTPQ